MLQALINGKLSSGQENMEDVLTSCVFGAFQYLPDHFVLQSFLREARAVSPVERPFKGLEIASAKYKFWPYWNNEGCYSCEPDVVLQVDSKAGDKWLVLIEVKYRSGKSGFSDDSLEYAGDQLAKEWENLLIESGKSKRKPMLIYVTADVLYPQEDIDAARRDLKDNGMTDCSSQEFHCYWVSWRSLFRVVSFSTDPLCQDIAKLARKLDLVEFDGFSSISPDPQCLMAYNSGYDWVPRPIERLDWSYG